MKEITELNVTEAKNVMGGVMPGPNGEGCTERGLPVLIPLKTIWNNPEFYK